MLLTPILVPQIYHQPRVVVNQLSQPITCMSTINVSGYTVLNNNITCMNNLNIKGYLFSSITSILTNNVNSLSTYSDTKSLQIYQFQSPSAPIFNRENSFQHFLI